VVAERRKRRHWSDAEKRMVCAQTRFAGVSVSQVARRYDVNANQVLNWLKNPCFAAGHENDEALRFLAVEIIDTVQPEEQPVATEGRMAVELAGGHRLSITGPYDPERLARLIRNLSE
jgi:transposase